VSTDFFRIGTDPPHNLPDLDGVLCSALLRIAIRIFVESSDGAGIQDQLFMFRQHYFPIFGTCWESLAGTCVASQTGGGFVYAARYLIDS